MREYHVALPSKKYYDFVCVLVGEYPKAQWENGNRPFIWCSPCQLYVMLDSNGVSLWYNTWESKVHPSLPLEELEKVISEHLEDLNLPQPITIGNYGIKFTKSHVKITRKSCIGDMRYWFFSKDTEQRTYIEENITTFTREQLQKIVDELKTANYIT